MHYPLTADLATATKLLEETEYDIEDLENGMSYDVAVRARNDAKAWSKWNPEKDEDQMRGTPTDDPDAMPKPTPALPILRGPWAGRCACGYWAPSAESAPRALSRESQRAAPTFRGFSSCCPPHSPGGGFFVAGNPPSRVADVRVAPSSLPVVPAFSWSAPSAGPRPASPKRLHVSPTTVCKVAHQISRRPVDGLTDEPRLGVCAVERGRLLGRPGWAGIGAAGDDFRARRTASHHRRAYGGAHPGIDRARCHTLEHAHHGTGHRPERART